MFSHTNPLHAATYDLFDSFRKKYNKNDRLLVAIMLSGGLDSVAVAHTLIKISKELNILPYLVYVDFKDYPEHEKTKQFVMSFSERYSVPLMIYDPKGYTDTKTSAREVMKSAAMGLDSDIIITGHHADDQIETFLFRAFRGSGVDGLAAMKRLSEFTDPRTGKIRVFGKPFLTLFKDEIEDYTFRSLPHVKDSSNLENGPNRNYIRNEVVPKINERFDKRNILSTINSINDHLTAAKEIETDYNLMYQDNAWCVNSMLSIPVMNRVFIIRRHLSKEHGFNLNKKGVTALKKVLSDDWTGLRHQINETLVLVMRDDYLVIETLD